jgi:hypothetical protein
MAGPVPISVVETPEFVSATRKLMSDDERSLLVDYLAYNPTAGDLIPGTGGVRSCDGDWKAEASAAAHG